ncbi:MAG: PAS domain-containing protein [Candidatus Binatia bacterium]
MSGRLRALLIDDSPEDADLLERHLRDSGYALTLKRVDDPATLPQILAAEPWDVALCKYVMPAIARGTDALAILRAAAPDLPAIAVAEKADDDVALEVMRAGARDCVGKRNLARLAPVIDREVQARRAAAQADGALRIASSWLRLAEDSAIVGFFFHDLQTDTITLSAQWCANLGYEPREITETRADFEARLHPLDLDDIRRFTSEQLAAGPRAASREFRLRQRDGSYCWVLARTAVDIDESGTPVRVVGVHIDVSDRRRADDVLALQATVTELLAEGVSMTRVRDARILYVNPAFERLFGYAAGELIGQLPEVLNATTPERSAEETARVIKESLHGTGQWSGEVHNRRKDGTTFWTHASITTAQHPEHGEIWVTAQRDVTERRKLQREVRDIRERLQLVAETVPQAFWMATRELDQMRYVSRGYERIWGRSCESLFANPRSFLDAIHPDDRERVTAAVATERDGPAFSMTYRVVRPDGTVRWVLDRGFPVRDASGTVTDYIGVAEDVTEREWFQRLLGIQHDLARAIASTSDLHEGLVACLDAALAITGFDAGGFYLLDEESGALDLVVHRGVSPAFAESSGHYEADAPQSRLVRAGAPHFQRFAEMGLPLQGAELSEGIVGLAVLPLQHQGRVIGCLNVGSRSTGEFSPLVRQALEVIAAESGQMVNRLQVEAEMRSGEARLRMAVEGADLGTWHCDLRTGDAQLSDRCLTQIGLAAGTRTTAQSVLAIMHPEDRLYVQASYREARDAGTDLDVEFRTQRADGTVRSHVLRGRFSGTEAGRPARIEGILLDVTRLRAAEAAERRSAETLRLFVDHAPAAIAMFDRDMRYLAVSRRYLEDYDLGEQSLVGRSHYDVFPEIPGRWREIHRRCLDGAVARAEDDPFQRADGRLDWVRWEIHPWYEAPGQVGGLVLFSELTTARKQAADALRQSEERLRLALEAAHMGTFDWDLVSDRITWTRRHEELWGFAPGEFAGTYAAFAARVHPGDLEAINAEVQRCIAMRDDFVRDFRVLWPDGSVRWISGRGSFTFDDNGAPIRMRGVVVDVSDLRRTEAALRFSEREFQSLFANMLEGVAQGQMVFDGQRASDFVLLSVNPAFEALSGLKGVVGKRMSDVVPGFADVVPEALATFGRVAQTGTPEHMEVELAPVHRWFSASVYGTTPGQFIAVFQDITDRKEAEARLQALNAELTRRVEERTVELEAANRDLQSFNYSVSHDLRAPLRHIDGFIRILEEDFAANLPAEAGRYLSLVRTGVGRMNGMIEALLRLSRLGRAALRLQRCEPAAIARSAFDELHATEPERTVVCEIGALPAVTADPALLRQVYDNLLANALKFTRPVAEARIEVGCERRDGHDAFFVRDNGVGFDAASATRLFDVFQRLHPAQQFEGTGVGLSIVRRIVERHEGRVWAESSPGNGATFWFTLGAA